MNSNVRREPIRIIDRRRPWPSLDSKPEIGANTEPELEMPKPLPVTHE